MKCEPLTSQIHAMLHIVGITCVLKKEWKKLQTDKKNGAIQTENLNCSQFVGCSNLTSFFFFQFLVWFKLRYKYSVPDIKLSCSHTHFTLHHYWLDSDRISLIFWKKNRTHTWHEIETDLCPWKWAIIMYKATECFFSLPFLLNTKRGHANLMRKKKHTLKQSQKLQP